MKATHLAPNQVVITDGQSKIFQSYDSIICKVDENGKVFLDEKFYKFSKTTAKYRNQFLGEDSKTIENKIKNGTYSLTNLN